MCGKFEMKQAEKEKWLGQQISAGGLAESVAETVAAKEGKIKAACIEVANIVNDWRTEIVGGLDADGAIKRKKTFFVRGRLAPSKEEKLVVLKENRKLIKEFKMRGNYEMKKGGEVNAFNLIQAVEEEGAGGQGADVDIEDLDLFFDDLEEDE